jgi:hypothetical protein
LLFESNRGIEVACFGVRRCQCVNISRLSPTCLVACAFGVSYRLFAIPKGGIRTRGPKPGAIVLREGAVERQRRGDAYDSVVISESAAVIAKVFIYLATQNLYQENTRPETKHGIQILNSQIEFSLMYEDIGTIEI